MLGEENKYALLRAFNSDETDSTEVVKKDPVEDDDLDEEEDDDEEDTKNDLGDDLEES